MAHTKYRITCPRCGKSYSKLLNSECPTCKEDIMRRKNRIDGYYIKTENKKQQSVQMAYETKKSLEELKSELMFVSSKCEEIDRNDYMYRYYKNRKKELERKIEHMEYKI